MLATRSGPRRVGRVKFVARHLEDRPIPLGKVPPMARRRILGEPDLETFAGREGDRGAVIRFGIGRQLAVQMSLISFGVT
jgi:hypothetical protein